MEIKRFSVLPAALPMNWLETIADLDLSHYDVTMLVIVRTVLICPFHSLIFKAAEYTELRHLYLPHANCLLSLGLEQPHFFIFFFDVFFLIRIL